MTATLFQLHKMETIHVLGVIPKFPCSGKPALPHLFPVAFAAFGAAFKPPFILCALHIALQAHII